MKYIRTKDGIEQVSYGEDFYEGKSYFYKTKYQWAYGDTYHKVKVKTYAKNGITKIADTIEELCDELVEYGNRPIVISQAKVIRGRMSGKTPVILGAIWTDKGLIYVAKMKGILSNGEIDWELL